MSNVYVHSNFEALPAGYLALFDTAAHRHSFFLSLPWFTHLSKSGVDRRIKCRIYGLESASPNRQVLAALPMWHDPASDSFFRCRKLTAAANYYSALFAPLFAGTESKTVQHQLTALISGIGQTGPGWDTIDLHPLEKETPYFPMLLRAFADADMQAFSYFCAGNWFLRVKQRSFEQIFAALPSRLKHTITRKSQQLNRSHRLKLTIVSAPDQVSQMIDSYRQIYARSWKQPEPFPEFVPGWMMESARQGWLRMGLAHIDGQPAAVQIWLVHQAKASIYKLAYDQQFAAYSIGSILTSHLLAHVIDIDQVSEVDFLNGDEHYKQDWMSERREYWGIIACNKHTWRGRIAGFMQQSARQFQHLKR